MPLRVVVFIPNEGFHDVVMLELPPEFHFILDLVPEFPQTKASGTGYCLIELCLLVYFKGVWDILICIIIVADGFHDFTKGAFANLSTNGQKIVYFCFSIISLCD